MNLVEDAVKLWPSFQWRYLLLLPVAAGIVHLVATFLAMSDTRNGAYQRLASVLPANAMKLLPPVKPGQQPLPFLGADAHYAMCRFSSKLGPVDVKVVLPDRGWSVGIYHPDGSTAYFASGAAGRPTAIALTLLPGDDRFLGLSPQALGKPASVVVQPVITAKQGFIVVRAPDRGTAYRLGDEAILAKASCTATPF